MRRNTLSLTIFVLALMLLQPTIPFTLASATPKIQASLQPSLTPMNTVPVDTTAFFTLNETHEQQVYSIPITLPGQYGFDMSFVMDNGTAGPWRNLDLELRESASQYVPHLNNYLQTSYSLDTGFWSWNTANYTGNIISEFVTVNPGFLVVTLDFQSATVDDRINGNFTVNHLFDFSSSVMHPWDQSQTISWTANDSWNSSVFTIVEHGYYNITLYSELPYDTTAGWGGDPFFQPFDKLQLFDITHGEEPGLFYSFTPQMDVPAGPGTGTANWTQFRSLKLAPDDYYLLGNTFDFLFLNGSYIDVNIDIQRVTMPTFLMNESITLSFDSSLPVNQAYVAITALQGFEYSMYYDNPVGANWSVQTYDVDTSWIPVTYFHYEDASGSNIVEDRFENCFTWAGSAFIVMAPDPSLTGDSWMESYSFSGSDVIYNNGTAVAASMGVSGLEGFTDTFFMIIEATPWSGTPTAIYNITLNFIGELLPTLAESGNVIPVNTTIGPMYQIFALPVTSGWEYEITGWSSAYTSAGGVSLFVAPGPDFYLDWQWFGSYGLYEPLVFTDPISFMPLMTANVNDSATIRFVPVRSGIQYVIVFGADMIGPPGDSTEVSVNTTVTPPTPYTLGAVMSHSFTEWAYEIYSVSIMAGASYRLSLSLDLTGDQAYWSAFNAMGFFPFAITASDLWGMVSMSTLDLTRTYTALVSGAISIVVYGLGPIEFSLVPVGEAPGSFILGLVIGLIFMVAGVIIVYVVMRRRY
ncbi:MAG: hypothetical protein ACFE8O_08760 [Candidatus Hermodarchaeota archaeon]